MNLQEPKATRMTKKILFFYLCLPVRIVQVRGGRGSFNNFLLLLFGRLATFKPFFTVSASILHRRFLQAGSVQNLDGALVGCVGRSALHIATRGVSGTAAFPSKQDVSGFSVGVSPNKTASEGLLILLRFLDL